MEMLGLLPREIDSLTATELSVLFRGRRKRKNEMLGLIAWCLHVLSVPHIPRASQHKVSSRRLMFGAPGFDADPEDIAP